MVDTAIQISVVGIDDKIFSFNTPLVEVSPKSLGNIGLKLAIQIRFAAETEDLTLRLDIRTFYNKSTPEQPDREVRLIRYVGEMHFRVRGGAQQFADPDEADEFLVPRDLVVSLLATTFSTFRGIIYAKLGGSEMRSMLLPLLEVDQVLEQMGEYIRPERA